MRSPYPVPGPGGGGSSYPVQGLGGSPYPVPGLVGRSLYPVPGPGGGGESGGVGPVGGPPSSMWTDKLKALPSFTLHVWAVIKNNKVNVLILNGNFFCKKMCYLIFPNLQKLVNKYEPWGVTVILQIIRVRSLITEKLTQEK